MRLETERLILRDFRATDWPDVLAYQSDPLYLRFNSWSHRTPEAVQAFVQRFVDQQQALPRIRFQLAIVLKTGRQVVGNCGIRMAAADSHEADIGYELAPSLWGNGYAGEAARAIVAFGFAELKLHRIWASCIAENIQSARVLTKLGMQQEGRLRDKEYFKGRWWDTLLFAILEDEWRGSQAAAQPAYIRTE